MQVVFSCEDNVYMWWQAELLHYSYLKTAMRDELTAIVAATEEANDFRCKTVRVANYKDRVAIEPLLSLNKPGGLAEWAALEGPRDETVLIVDTDSVFHYGIADPGPIADGEAYSEPHDYMAVDAPENKKVIERHCKLELRARIQPVGIYILINRRCLELLAPRWLEKTVEIASDPVCREVLGGTGWLSEMWGYAIAAAELGIYHHLRGFSQVTGSGSLERPITHYCFPLMPRLDGMWSPHTQKPVLWSKWEYVPWSCPPDPNNATPEGRFLLEQLWELAISKQLEAEEQRGRSELL